MEIIITIKPGHITSLIREAYNGHDLDEVVTVAELKTSCPTCGEEVFAFVNLQWEIDEGYKRYYRREAVIDAECGTCGKVHVPLVWVSDYADPNHVKWALKYFPGREVLKARLEQHICQLLQSTLKELGLLP